LTVAEHLPRLQQFVGPPGPTQGLVQDDAQVQEHWGIACAPTTPRTSNNESANQIFDRIFISFAQCRIGRTIGCRNVLSMST
jgi:hypothetical protein